MRQTIRTYYTNRYAYIAQGAFESLVENQRDRISDNTTFQNSHNLVAEIIEINGEPISAISDSLRRHFNVDGRTESGMLKRLDDDFHEPYSPLYPRDPGEIV